MHPTAVLDPAPGSTVVPPTRTPTEPNRKAARRTSVIIGCGMVAALAAGGGCAADDDKTNPAGGPESPAATDPLPEHLVGQDDIELVDESRPTAADPLRRMPSRRQRTIAVTVLYPARGETGDDPDPDPIPDAAVAAGDFPLVVFSHGVTGTGDDYLHRLRHWAAAGYVVAAPTYPLTSGSNARIDDVVNQPGDVSFVIDELLVRSRTPDDALYRHVNAERIGLAGHSLGAITAIGATFNSCCRDTRVDAAVEISGLEFPFPGGNYADWPATPLLAIHGARDTTIPVSGSAQLIAKARPPTYYLRFSEAAHSDLLYGESGALVDDAVIAFLDHYLVDQPRQLENLPHQVRESGLATFDIDRGETVPPPGGAH